MLLKIRGPVKMAQAKLAHFASKTVFFHKGVMNQVGGSYEDANPRGVVRIK